MKQKKLVWQIFPATLIIVFAAIVAMSWYGASALHDFYTGETKNDLEARAMLIKSQVKTYLLHEEIDKLRDFCVNGGRESGTRITIIDRAGVVLADSYESPEAMDNHRGRPEITTAYKGEIGVSMRYSATLKESLLYVAVPLFEPNEFLDGVIAQQVEKTVVRMSMPVNSIDNTLDVIRSKIILGSCVVIILAGLITLFVSRNISRPLEEMTKNARLFALGDFSQRMVATQRTSASLELATLGKAMDQMAALLDEKIKAIETHRNQLETVFSSMVESVIALDKNERIISLNKAASRLLAVERNKVHGKNLQEVIRNFKLQQHIDKILITKESVMDELVLQDDEGEKYLQINVEPLHDSENRRVGILLVMNDITRMRRLEKIRQDFVANVSHELRTPITSIRGYVETLLDGALDSREDTERFLEIVLKQAGRLSEIIDDLLSLSRIEQESKLGEIDMVPGPLCMVLDSAVEVCQLEAQQKGVNIVLECPETVRFPMNGTLFEQAIVNLLVNAIKYSEEGGCVTVTAEFEELNSREVLIRVKDTGVGIGKEHLPRLFERFYRSDKARSREFGGTGLGLAIVKHIVQSHGGRVTVKSEEGVGTEFILVIPA